MDRSFPATAKDNQVSFLPQLPQQRYIKPAQSPSNSPRISARLPHIHTRKDEKDSLTTKLEERCRVPAYSPISSLHFSAGVKCAECSWKSNHSEASPLGNLTPVSRRRGLPATAQENPGKMVSKTVFTSESSNQASEDSDEEPATPNTTYFSKPCFGRRSAAQRSSLYRARSLNDDVLDSEILAMEEKGSHVFAAPDAPLKLKDLNGRKLGSSSVFKEDITCMLPSPRVESSEYSAAQPARRHNTRARKRFLDALDLHYYNNFLASDPGRRMAVCEEIEHTIVVGNITLAWYREHLRLQAVLDAWYL